MSDTPLKPIAREGVPAALEKAQRYRLLNEPAQAESIYRDVLAAEEKNQEALRGLVLALTDQLGGTAGPAAGLEARETIRRLGDEYDREYFTGILWERETRAYLERPGILRSGAFEGFRRAMDAYARAEALRRPPANVDAVLRWNSCVRAIERERLTPDDDRRNELPLE